MLLINQELPKITDIVIYPMNDPNFDKHLIGFVRVVLNDSLILNGLKIYKDKFKYYVTYPNHKNNQIKNVLQFKIQKEIIEHYKENVKIGKFKKSEVIK